MPVKKNASATPERPTLIVPLEEAKEKIAAQLVQGRALLEREITNREQLAEAERQARIWEDVTEQLLISLFNTQEQARKFVGVVGIQSWSRDAREVSNGVRLFQSDVISFLDRLTSLDQSLHLFPSPVVTNQPIRLDVIATVERVARRFHLVARQLRARHNERATLEIEDEYDVQDFLHALLRLYFDDVRKEEWTPSYAGGASRMDFLLKAEKVVIEAKKTRSGLGAKEVGTQLLEDIGRYHIHPDCRSLVCFVYDPEARIANPDGLERDLSRPAYEMAVTVIVAPKGQ